MDPPFGGLFGDTSETRLLRFLLPMYGIGFNMAELVTETGLTRQSIARALKKFQDRGMVKIQKEGRTPQYSINEDSPLVKRLEDFDNALIASIVGEEMFRPTTSEHKKPVRAKAPGIVTKGPEKTAIPYGRSETKASGVASRGGAYSATKMPTRKKPVSR